MVKMKMPGAFRRNSWTHKCKQRKSEIEILKIGTVDRQNFVMFESKLISEFTTAVKNPLPEQTLHDRFTPHNTIYGYISKQQF